MSNNTTICTPDEMGLLPINHNYSIHQQYDKVVNKDVSFFFLGINFCLVCYTSKNGDGGHLKLKEFA